MVFDLIRGLQLKSEAERRHIAFLVALTVTSLIFAFWLYAFLTTTLAPKSVAKTEAVASTTPIGPSPFTAISDAFSGIIRTFSDGFGKVDYYNNR